MLACTHVACTIADTATASIANRDLVVCAKFPSDIAVYVCMFAFAFTAGRQATSPQQAFKL